MLAPPRAAILERSYVSHSLGSLVAGKEKMQLSAAASFLITATSRHKRQKKNDSISSSGRARESCARDLFTSSDVIHTMLRIIIHTHTKVKERGLQREEENR